MGAFGLSIFVVILFPVLMFLHLRPAKKAVGISGTFVVCERERRERERGERAWARCLTAGRQWSLHLHLPLKLAFVGRSTRERQKPIVKTSGVQT